MQPYEKGAPYSVQMYRGQDMPDDRLECKPRYCISPIAILRWIQVVVGFVVMVLITWTCNSDACLYYVNQYGDVAQVMIYNVIAGHAVIVCTLLIMIGYSLNLHRAAGDCLVVLERVYTGVAIGALVVLGIVQTMYALNSWRDEFWYLGRGADGIRPNWIAAAVLAWINVLLYVVDMVAQCTANYPTNFSRV